MLFYRRSDSGARAENKASEKAGKNEGRLGKRKMDLAIDPKTGNKRDIATIRELLQMRACDKIPDTGTRVRLIREVLIEKLWLEKQGGGVS